MTHSDICYLTVGPVCVLCVCMCVWLIALRRMIFEVKCMHTVTMTTCNMLLHFNVCIRNAFQRGTFIEIIESLTMFIL